MSSIEKGKYRSFGTVSMCPGCTLGEKYTYITAVIGKLLLILLLGTSKITPKVFRLIFLFGQHVCKGNYP